MGDIPSGSLAQLLRKSPGFEMGTIRPKLHQTEILSVETAQALDGFLFSCPPLRARLIAIVFAEWTSPDRRR